MKDFFVNKYNAVFLGLAGLVSVANAQSKFGGTTDGESVSLPNPLGVKTISELIKRVFRYSLIIGSSLVGLFILIGAFYILTSGGNEDKLKTGKKTITYAVVGYAIILLAEGVIYIINELLSGSGGA